MDILKRNIINSSFRLNSCRTFFEEWEYEPQAQVEYENASQIFKNPKDKYTKYLIDTRLQLTEPFIKSMYKKEEVI